MGFWLPKRKTLVVSFLFLLAGVVVYSTGVYLVLAKIGEIRNAYTESESVVAKEEKARLIAQVANENADKIQALRDYFITEGDEVSFIEKIEAVAKASELTFEIDSITQSKVVADSIKIDLIVRIKIEGSWPSIMGFMSDLEKMSFGASIVNANLDSNKPGNWQGFVELVVFREK